MKESWADLRPIGQDDQGLYFLMIPYTEVISGPVVGDADFYIALVSEDAELVKKQAVNFKIDGKPSTFEFTQEINGRLLFFTSVEDKGAKTVTFYTQEVDKKTLQLSSPRKVVEMSFAHVKREYRRASFKCELSRDKSKMLISYSLIDKDDSMLTFGYVVLDSGLKEVYTWSGNLDMTDGVYLFDQFRITNKGEVYLLTRYFRNNKALDKNTSMSKTNIFTTTKSVEYHSNYEHRVVKFEGKSDSKVMAIPNSKKFYSTIDIGLFPDGNILLAGFYSGNEENIPSGAVCLKLNPKTGAVQETGSKDFGSDFQMPSDISIKNNGLVAGKDQYLNYRFIISDIHYHKSGGFTLIGERNVTQSKRTGNTFYTVNHLDDLAVIEISGAGAINAIHKVVKSQQAADMEIFNASYFFFEQNNVRYLAFANMGKGVQDENVLVRIAADGKQSREVMFTRGETEVTIRPKACAVFRGGKLMIYGTKNNRYSRWLSFPF